MRQNFKEVHSLDSTILSEQQSIESFSKGLTRRFTRSNSGSRSKSKQKSKHTETRRFFVKNICQQMLSGQPQSQSLMQKFQAPREGSPSRPTRVPTPAKQRKQIKKTIKDPLTFEEGLQHELQILKLEQQLKTMQIENDRLKTSVKDLKEQLAYLHQQLAESKIQINGNKVEETPVRHGRSNNLIKLKNKIASSYQDQPLSSVQQLQQENCKLKAEIQRIAVCLKAREDSLQKIKKEGKRISSEREQFLDDLVTQQRIELTQHRELIRKLRIKLDVFQVQQVHQSDRAEAQKGQQIGNIKKKYSRVLKMYYETTQELAAIKRKNERLSKIFLAEKSRKSSLDSLHLSP